MCTVTGMEHKEQHLLVCSFFSLLLPSLLLPSLLLLSLSFPFFFLPPPSFSWGITMSFGHFELEISLRHASGDVH